MAWWQDAVVYQIYPRSFADGDGDGVGDLCGIVERLDHLPWLGVDALWLSPIYRSPMADFGYDVSDHTAVDPTFGTLDDADALIAAAHERGLKVIFDIVVGHTSHEHPWFVAARSSRDDPKRDWYVWADGRPGGEPPNNWVAGFPEGARAWTYDDRTGQWYLHSHLPEQPDLNWDNPAVCDAMSEVLRFWLDRGVDGFRLDAVARIGKDPQLRDNPPDGRERQQDWPSVHDHLREIRAVLDEYPERMTVGEVWLQDQRRLAAYVTSGDGLDLAHNFVFARLRWDAEAFRRTVEEFAALTGPDVWPAWFLNNHDEPRMASRFDEDGRGPQRARVAAVALLTLRGTPFLYQGEELGLRDTDLPPGHGPDPGGRDPQRTPMPWERPSRAGPGAAFTDAVPWLPVGPDAEETCVEAQRDDPASALNLYRRLLALRRSRPSLLRGDQRSLPSPEGVWAYERATAGERTLVLLNFATEPAQVRLDAAGGGPPRVLLSSRPDRREDSATGSVELAPLEALVLDAAGHGVEPR